MVKKILVVDDEKEITDLVGLYLENEGYEVYKYYNGRTVLEGIESIDFDLAIIDIMLPDIDGFTILKLIREKYNFPIIMLTAKDEEIDKIRGLTIGADDYITKPFKPLELLARVKAQLRRYTRYNKSEKKENIISIRGLFIDLESRKVVLDEEELKLTPTEYSILKILAENQGSPVSSEELFKKVWKEKYYTSSNNTIMVHIRHLREKMKDSVEDPNYIKTVWGVGYRID